MVPLLNEEWRIRSSEHDENRTTTDRQTERLEEDGVPEAFSVRAIGNHLCTVQD
jgi:hypothetical protein